MSDNTKQDSSKQKASEVNLIEEYNSLLKEIPWDNLGELPKKLSGVANFLPGISFKPEDIDIVTPLRRIVTYVGVLVKRIRSSERKIVVLEKQMIEHLKEKSSS